MTVRAKPKLDLEFQNPVETEPTYPPELEEKIRARAYELYEQRGGITGHDLDDWVQAEKEVMGQPRITLVA